MATIDVDHAPAPVSSGDQLLPRPRGPVSTWLDSRLRGLRCPDGPPPLPAYVLGSDDAQLSMHVIYELSYRGYAGVDDAMERDPHVLRLARRLEDAMEAQLRQTIGALPADPIAELRRLAAPGSGPSLSAHIADRPDVGLLREFSIHRSAYQLKEADPHSWALPRLSGRAKAALVEIQSDEYGQGVPGRSHAELFATTMRALGLDPSYGRYVDELPACTLATGNLISLLGRQRRLLPALIGHLALFEMTSTGPMQRYSDALRAAGLGAEAREFFDVHVVADAHHEVLALTDLVGGHLEQRPESGPEICFGARALVLVEQRFSAHLLDSFRSGRTSLRTSAPGDVVESDVLLGT